MTKYIILVLGLILLPSVTFAAAPNEAYISFLQQEIKTLQAELVLLQEQLPASTTEATSTLTGSVEAVEATTTESKSACAEWRQYYLGQYCTSWVL